MKVKQSRKREGPLRVSHQFDDAIRRALQVSPPPEGWTKYEEKLTRRRQRQRKKEDSAIHVKTCS